MTKLEKLIDTIMKDAKKDGEPVTYEQAKEMAEMEIKANTDIKRYEQAEKPRKKAEKVRKVDETKKMILTTIFETIQDDFDSDTAIMENETNIHFTYKNDKYTIKLTKHRPPKN